MKIIFKTLEESNFPLLLKWLEKTHVKDWWDSNIDWTLDSIKKKYSTYVKGYKLVDGAEKSINSYIINVDKIPIGYIQIYNAYDFPRNTTLVDLPKSLAAFDIFIGEEAYLGKNLGSKILKIFLDEFMDKEYEAVFADPDSNNIAAIKAYTSAGFQKVKESVETGEIWMIKELKQKS